MAYIILDKEGESGMRQQMRRNMRGGYRTHDGGMGTTMMRGNYNEGYRQGYKHGWEDHEDDMMEDENYRRQRDSRGRYI